MKEAFSADFLHEVIKVCALDQSAQGLKILDPFAGSGTTGVSAASLRPRATVCGTEVNPMLHLLASTKQRSLGQRFDNLTNTARRVSNEALARIDKGERFRRPELSTFKRLDYFNQAELRKLLAIVSELERRRSCEGESLELDLLRVAAAACVEPISKLRRDGRALRYSQGKSTAKAVDEFLRIVETIQIDVGASTPGPLGRQVLGDARSVGDEFCDDGPFDLAVFSPPYPNNIDYTEVYKMEAWLLGFHSTAEDFRAQRLRSLHSHPSLRRRIGAEAALTVQELIEPIVAEIPPGRYGPALVEMVTGYLIDMGQVLSEVKRVLRPGGRVVFAVGNSCHGGDETGVVIAADALLMAVGERVGLVSEEIRVARRLTRKRHDSKYLRESVCFLRNEGEL